VAEAVFEAVPFAPDAFGGGRGASQIVHFSFAVPGFFSMHVSHSHCSSPCAAAGAAEAVGAAGAADPAAAFGAGRGVSQIVHFSFAVPGFFSMHVSHSHCSSPCVGIVAVAVAADVELVSEGRVKLNFGGVAFSACSLAFAVAATSLADEEIVKVKKGRAGFATARAVSRAERKTLVGSKVDVDGFFGCSFSTGVASSFEASSLGAAGLDGLNVNAGVGSFRVDDARADS